MTAFRFYYGYVVLAASAMCELLMQGAASYSAGLFILPLQAEFHLSRAASSAPLLIFFLGAALMAPLAGRALDRFSMRLVMAAGAVAFGVGLAGIAWASSLWVMALMLLVPVALGFAAAGPLNTVTVAARWFHRRRGLALGLAAVATSGGALMVPLVSRLIQQQGWRQALALEGAGIAAIVMLLAILVMRDSPRAIGLAGHPEQESRDLAASASHPDWRQILSRRDFWIPSLVLVSITSTSQVIVMVTRPWGAQLGVPNTATALFITAFGLCAGVTKIVSGLLSDRMDKRWLLSAASLFIAAAHLLLFLSPGHDTLLLASCLAGLALGCAMPAAMALIAQGFGGDAFGGVVGWTYTLSGLATIATVLFSGFVFDRVHTYVPVFGGFAGMVLAVFLVALLFPPQPAARA